MKKVILLFFVITTTFFSSFAIAQEKEVSKDSGIKDLTSLEILKQDFKVHQDQIRIVTLLSPT